MLREEQLSPKETGERNNFIVITLNTSLEGALKGPPLNPVPEKGTPQISALVKPSIPPFYYFKYPDGTIYLAPFPSDAYHKAMDTDIEQYPSTITEIPPIENPKDPINTWIPVEDVWKRRVIPNLVEAHVDRQSGDAYRQVIAKAFFKNPPDPEVRRRYEQLAKNEGRHSKRGKFYSRMWLEYLRRESQENVVDPKTAFWRLIKGANDITPTDPFTTFVLAHWATNIGRIRLDEELYIDSYADQNPKTPKVLQLALLDYTYHDKFAYDLFLKGLPDDIVDTTVRRIEDYQRQIRERAPRPGSSWTKECKQWGTTFDLATAAQRIIKTGLKMKAIREIIRLQKDNLSREALKKFEIYLNLMEESFKDAILWLQESENTWRQLIGGNIPISFVNNLIQKLEQEGISDIATMIQNVQSE